MQPGGPWDRESFERARVEAELRRELFGDQVATKLGRFTVVERIGAGGMGVVYAAYDPELDRRVAIKLLASDHSGADRESRLRREAQAMAKLNHPNVATVYEVGVHDARIFIAMEMIEGRSLRAWLEEQRRDWREVLDAFLQAGDGLVAAHEAGLVHRDFKPDNAMMGVDGRVRVLDFGLARSDVGSFPDAVGSATPATGERLTVTGSVLGTPAYMPPEQLAAHDADARSDQFSFCVALYEALYGQRPFGGDSVDELAAEIRKRRVRVPARRAGPSWLLHALRRGLEPDPDRRWPALADLLTALRSARRRRLARIATATLLLVVAAGGTGLYLARPAAVCGQPGPELAGIWDDAERARLRERFAEADPPFALSTYERLADDLDAFAGDWSAAWTDACGNDEDPRARLRELDCLRQARQELRVHVGGLALSPVFETVMRPDLAVARVADPRECTDPRIVRATPEPPSLVEAEQVEALRAELLGLQALRAATGEEVAQAFDPLVARAEGLTYPVLAEVLVAYAERLDRVEAPEAEAIQARAMMEAERSRHDRALARAELLRAATYVRKGFTEQLAATFDDVEVAIARAGNPADLDVALLRARAVAATATRSYGEARSHIEAALQRYEARYGPGDLRLADLLVQALDIAGAEVDLEGGRDAGARLLSIVDDDHPGEGLVHLLVAELEWLAGEREAAEASRQRAVESFDRARLADGTQHPGLQRAHVLAQAVMYEAAHRCVEGTRFVDSELATAPPNLAADLHALAVLIGLSCDDAGVGDHAERGVALVDGGRRVFPVFELALRAVRGAELAASGRAGEAEVQIERITGMRGRAEGRSSWTALVAGAIDPQRGWELGLASLPEADGTRTRGRALRRLQIIRVAGHGVRVGKAEDALSLLAPILGGLQRCCADTPAFAWARFIEAQARWDLDRDRPAAVEAAREAAETLRAAGPLAQTRASAVEAWLLGVARRG